MSGAPTSAIDADLKRIKQRLLRLRTKLTRLARSKGDSRSWQIFVVVFPVVLTIGGGLYVESRLARLGDELKADEQRRDVVLRLAETLYTERLKVYVEIDQALLNVERRLREGRLYASTDSPDRHRPGLNDGVIKLRELYEGRRLYLTAPLIESLENVVRRANSASQAERVMPAHLEQFLKSLDTARAQMLANLRPEAFSITPPSSESSAR